MPKEPFSEIEIDLLVKKLTKDEDSARELRAGLSGKSPARQRLIIDAWKWRAKWRAEHPRPEGMKPTDGGRE